MTDGILLAETQGDPFLDQYDTIILDEAHERSLNIDFLIGYLKRLLPKRRDLKLIITSATIDAARFSRAFRHARRPRAGGRSLRADVSGRGPLAAADGRRRRRRARLAAGGAGGRRGSRRPSTAATSSSSCPPSGTSTRRPRRSAAGRCPAIRPAAQTEILPLYARLSMREQQRVFQPGAKRRIVIATNVAESSLTVPRIRYVIDPGTARISRYSPRSKTQRLPIEADLAGVGRPAQGPLRADRAGHLRPAVQRGGLPGPRPLHRAGDPADQSGRRHSADEGPAAGRDRAVPVPRSAQARGRSRRLPNARRAGRARRQGRADRDRPPVEPPAGRSADSGG